MRFVRKEKIKKKDFQKNKKMKKILVQNQPKI